MICREMHWTEAEYDNTSADFIDSVRAVLSAEAEAHRLDEQLEKAKSKARNRQ